MTRRIHPLFWLIIPVILMLADIVAELTVPDEFKPRFYSEGGPLEKIQGVILLVALLYAVRLFMKVDGLWLKVWFGIAALCCLYVGGEEISWGQHYFGWMTPEYWQNINDQQETNLHNTSSWLDQKPRALLEIGVLVGGLIIPALQKFKADWLPVKFSPVYPTWHLTVTTGFAVFIKLLDVIEDAVDRHIFWRSSEVMETYLYYFVLLYMIVMWKSLLPEKDLAT